MLLSRRHLTFLTLMITTQAFAGPCCGPITPDAVKLTAFLDSTRVERLWLVGFDVDWRTGAIQGLLDRHAPDTHCSAYVASVADRLGVYILRPPEHSLALLANAQVSWLDGGLAAESGWRRLRDVVEAQTVANRGELVIAAYRNKYPERPGHVAVVRASDIDRATLLADGPFVAQAGAYNSLSTPLARGFANRGVWIPGGGGDIRFYAHPLTKP